MTGGAFESAIAAVLAEATTFAKSAADAAAAAAFAPGDADGPEAAFDPPDGCAGFAGAAAADADPGRACGGLTPTADAAAGFCP
jgi:hypothetical protein